MHYEYVEFEIVPPIDEPIKKLPGDIRLEDNNILRVLLNEEVVDKIKNQKLKDVPQDSTYLNRLNEALKKYSKERAAIFLSKLNYEIQTYKYKDLIYKALAYRDETQRLVTEREACIGMSATTKIDEINIEDSYDDNELDKMYANFNKGMKFDESGEYFDAYYHFYLIVEDLIDILFEKQPQPHLKTYLDNWAKTETFSNIEELLRALKILRHAVSHNKIDRVDEQILKKLFGDGYARDKNGRLHFSLNRDSEFHREVYMRYLPCIKGLARMWIGELEKSSQNSQSPPDDEKCGQL